MRRLFLEVKSYKLTTCVKRFTGELIFVMLLDKCPVMLSVEDAFSVNIYN